MYSSAVPNLVLLEQESQCQNSYRTDADVRTARDRADRHYQAGLGEIRKYLYGICWPVE